MILAVGKLQAADYFILIAYFALMLGIGVYFYRYMRRMKDFFSGGNTIPWWLSGVSFYMSCFSAFGFIAYSALAYEFGWVSVTLFWVMAPATMVSVIFFSAKWRRARIDSPVEYLETRYSSTVRQLFAWEGLPVRIIDDSLKLVAIGTFIAVSLDLPAVDSLTLLGLKIPLADLGLHDPLRYTMVVTGLIMLAYTFMGGLWAVTVTDFVQFIVMIAAVIVLLPLSISEAGGTVHFLQDSPEGFFHLTSPKYDWIYLCSTIFLFCLAFSSVNWSLIQRYYCVPKEKDAIKVGWLVFALSILGPPLILLPAMAASHFLPGIENTNQVYPLLCVRLLPAGMLGLIIAAMFSATMSMLSSDYNVAASVLTNDLYRRYINPNASQQHLVWIGRGMTAVIGFIALGIAFLMAAVEGDALFKRMITLFSVATAPVALPMIAGLLSKRITNRGTLAGCLLGVTAGLMCLLLFPETVKIKGIIIQKENIILWCTTSTTLVVMTLVSCLFPRSTRERDQVDAFHKRLDTPIGELEEDIVPASTDGKGAISPFGVVGVSTMIVGGMMLTVSTLTPILRYETGSLAFGMNLGVGLVLLVLGAVVALASRRSK